MQLGFYFDQSRCIGCCTCVIACKDWHDVPAGPASWIRVLTLERGKYPYIIVDYMLATCYHCAEPLCVPACPIGAIEKRKEDGVVVVNREACLGGKSCQVCRETCPYDTPQFRTGDNAKMEKCNLCLDRLAENKNPVCVDACPLRALDVGPLDQLRKKYGEVMETDGFVYSAETKPSIVFKLKMKRYSEIMRQRD